jgi:hypothetical protein
MSWSCHVMSCHVNNEDIYIYTYIYMSLLIISHAMGGGMVRPGLACTCTCTIVRGGIVGGGVEGGG